MTSPGTRRSAAGSERESTPVPPEGSPCFFAAARRSCPFSAAGASTRARLSARASAFCRLTASATFHLISANGGTAAGRCSTTLTTASPPGVLRGPSTPPSAAANTASSTAWARPIPSRESPRARSAVFGSRPRRRAPAEKTLAPWSGPLTSSALARALPLLALVFFFDLGGALLRRAPPALLDVGDLDGVIAERRAHGLRGDLAPLQGEGRLLERRHQFAPRNVAEVAARPGRRRIFGDVLRELGEILPRPHPLEDLLHLGLGVLFGLAPPHRRHANQDVGHLHAPRLLELGGALLVIPLHLRVGGGPDEALRAHQHVLEPPPFGLLEPERVLLQEVLQLRIGRLDVRHEGRNLDLGPGGPDLLPPELVRLAYLRIGNLDPLLDGGLQLLPHELPPLVGLEDGRVDLGAIQDGHVAIPRELAVLLEGPDGLDLGPELVVAHLDPLRLGALKDQHLFHQEVHDLLGDPEAFGSLRGEAVLEELPVELEVGAVEALVALEGNLLAVDRGHGVGVAAGDAPLPPDEHGRADEGGDHHPQGDRESFQVLSQGLDHRRLSEPFKPTTRAERLEAEEGAEPRQGEVHEEGQRGAVHHRVHGDGGEPGHE